MLTEFRRCLSRLMVQLMQMGAYDNSMADSLALGTTTDYLIRNSPAPVLVHH